jgi:hypothetical protein
MLVAGDNLMFGAPGASLSAPRAGGSDEFAFCGSISARARREPLRGLQRRLRELQLQFAREQCSPIEHDHLGRKAAQNAQ